jgi:hypothetical protein
MDADLHFRLTTTGSDFGRGSCSRSGDLDFDKRNSRGWGVA